MAAYEERQIITHINPKSPVSEAYRALRTNLRFSTSDEPLKSLLITSAGPGEGKSTTIANLAVAMAQSGNKVLIVDTELRKPTQHRIFKLDNSLGLTNILVENLALEEVIQTTIIEGVHILTSGAIPPNPSELLGTGRMKDLAAKLKDKYDMVLFDTPPIIAVTDAVVLSPLADGIIMVVKAGVARVEMVKEAKAQLEKANAKIIGTLLNGTPTQGDNYQHYYYYGETKKEPWLVKKIMGLF